MFFYRQRTCNRDLKSSANWIPDDKDNSEMQGSSKERKTSRRNIKNVATRTENVPFASKIFAMAASKASSFGSSQNNDGGHSPLARARSSTFMVVVS
jgi:hypothetical protein